MELREARDVAKEALKTAEDEYRAAETDVHEALSEGPVDRINNVDLGAPWGKVSFHAKETTFGRILDKDKAKEYFAATGELKEISEPKFVMARINEIVRAHDEQSESLPDGIDFYKKRYVQITRQK